MVIEPPLDPADFPTAAALNARIAEISARHIREHIDQWCIFRPLWEPDAAAATQGATEPRRVTV